MFIRSYGNLPMMYAPDIGQVLEARRTAVDDWTRAAVVKAHRNRDGHLQVMVQWLEDNDQAGAPDRGQPRVPIVAMTKDSLVLQEGMPPLLRALDGDMPFGQARSDTA